MLGISLEKFVGKDPEVVYAQDVSEDCSNFVSKGSSFEAEDGATDDLVMCLVLYSWLTNQNYFKELTDDDIRKRLYQSQQKMIEEDMAPFGFVDDGISMADDAPFVDVEGDLWTPTKMGPTYW